MTELKKKMLELLERDREFRHAVAGLIGYGDLLEKMEEHDRKFNEILAQIAEIMERQAEHDRKFNEILERLEGLERELERVRMRVEVTIGSMGRRWGRDLERTTLEIFREVLEREGIEPGRVERFVRVDEDGSVTGVKGRRVEADILVRDGRLYILEVKSHASLDDVEWFHQVSLWVERFMGRKLDRLILVAVNVDDDALERARELGMGVVFGNVIRLTD